ncbi:hypothetical protein D5687_10445 [Guyparkeria sp. SCN-R1]|nr:hypothetical protein D5687_10445 [Guyparkeria sp. SCN-R1]
MNGKTRREMMQIASHVSYFSLACALWMAASIIERDSGSEWSSLLIGWAPALELKAIFYILLFVAIRTVLNYLEETDSPSKQ